MLVKQPAVRSYRWQYSVNYVDGANNLDKRAKRRMCCSSFRFRSQILLQFTVCLHRVCNGLVNTAKLTGDQ